VTPANGLSTLRTRDRSIGVPSTTTSAGVPLIDAARPAISSGLSTAIFEALTARLPRSRRRGGAMARRRAKERSEAAH
jgi:hypothetical protein